MKNLITLLFIALLLFNITTLSYAQESKVITLKDGSILKGKVLELTDGIYTLETENLGNITILEANILSIAAPSAARPASEENNSTELKKQVEQMQGTIMADEELMMGIQGLTEDEEIKAILSDPNLITDVMSFDQDKIEQNTNIQNLMNNPKMQQLMNQVQQKVAPAQE